jgi:hypothetical protein
VVSEEKIFKNRSIRNKNCLWRPCLLMDRDKMTNLYKGPSIDASYQVSVHLAKQFQRRRFKKKTANQKQELPEVYMFVNGSGRNEQSLYRAFNRCFLPNFRSIGFAFQRRRLKCEKLTDDRRRTTDAKWWQKLTLPLARWAKKTINCHKMNDIMNMDSTIAGSMNSYS